MIQVQIQAQLAIGCTLLRENEYVKCYFEYAILFCFWGYIFKVVLKCMHNVQLLLGVRPGYPGLIPYHIEYPGMVTIQCPPLKLSICTFFSNVQARPGSRLRWSKSCLNIIWALILTKFTLNSICKMNIQNAKCKNLYTESVNWICKIQNAKNFTDMLYNV